MSSFKRKRIETWCDEVAQYLFTGGICRSVMSNVAEDAICGNSLTPLVDQDDVDNRENVISTSAVAFDNSKPASKQDSGVRNSVQPSASPTDKNVSASFPYVRFTYNHYHEQRRKIDRLVQGLPVLNSNSVSTVERPESKTSTEEHVPIIIVNGEEPVRNPHSRSRSSSQPRRHAAHNHSHAHLSGTNIIQPLQTPRTARQVAHESRTRFRVGQPRPMTLGGLRRSNSSAARFSGLKAGHSPEIAVTVDPGLGLAERTDRIKTAPAPNRNVTRARQRILTRRNTNRILEHTSQIPLQNCWAMAELTW